jgi:SNF2 family DNA or RNA helicase
MSMHAASIDTIGVHVALSEQGDALFYGSTDNRYELSGLYLKQRLFAWHEASFYGTELVVHQVQGVDIVILPAEQVIPFFAEGKLLRHLDWNWGGDGGLLLRLAPLLGAAIEEKRYVPSFDAYRRGIREWRWEDEALEALVREAAKRSDDEAADGGEGAEAGAGLDAALQAAYSAAVEARHYGTDADATDLRREFPLLWTVDSAMTAGLDARSWLVAVGWRADTAPFRPALQLLEPDDELPEWRLRLALQDKRDESALVPVRLAADGTAAGDWPTGAWAAHVEERAAGWLDRLRAILPAAAGMQADYVGSADVLGEPLSDEAAWRFLAEDSRRLLDSGWQVLLPAWWEAARKKKPRLRAKVSSQAGGGRGQSLFGLDAIIDFDWRIAIGDADLTEAEFAELVARGQRLIKFKGQWIPLDPALLEQIRRAMAGMDQRQGLSFQDVLQLHLLGTGDAPDGGAQARQEEETRVRLEVELNAHLTKLIAQLGQQTEWPALPVPAGLRAELRSYQQDGYAWLAFLGRYGLGACLADDMGLGKTVQLIAYLLHRKEEMAEAGAHSPALIICPTSVLGNWQKELARFAPSLSIMLHYSSKRQSGERFLAEAMAADVVLTSYATAALDQETLQGLTWSTVCLDEAQNIKNAQTKQSTAVRSLKSRHRVALTGTPIENRLSELWSIYDFISPGYLGSPAGFQARFANAIERDRDEQRTADLQRLVKPFMLRRKKKDPAIQLDLPEKNEMKSYVPLTAEQGALYEQTVNQLLEKMQKLEGIERKGAILAALTQLKQLCDHPVLLTKEAVPGLTPGVGASKDSGAGNVGAAGPDAAGSAIPLDTELLASRSAKLERLLAMVKEVREEGERCLIFTQYVGMGQMLQAVLRQELQEPVLYLNGSTSKTARDRMIEQFQAPRATGAAETGVFILSLKAGGVGLNLTAANHVFHYDRWWNPAVENQATDRAYRMGQTRDVQVHKFISLGTLEERIDEMLENKQQLSDNVIASSEGWITELSTDELKDLFTLRRDWVN